jgi:hypothetical protein
MKTTLTNDDYPINISDFFPNSTEKLTFFRLKYGIPTSIDYFEEFTLMTAECTKTLHSLGADHIKIFISGPPAYNRAQFSSNSPLCKLPLICSELHGNQLRIVEFDLSNKNYTNSYIINSVDNYRAGIILQLFEEINYITIDQMDNT